jgi:hypothetical protein
VSGSDRRGPPSAPPDRSDEIVGFFLSLTPEARREYEALAALDRRFGEDVEGEARATDPEKS